ncbi:MAG TPA: extracellular solute-binding protein [Candidatus Eisenbergiella pullistercoris]|uniref:Extracellular solute-binding protein n=1 Tax=Candidatus Eisenbergiella pullistercoris TaxID=2838555 RepID=A0A9D1YPX0_9FIRM|nr:extracellular solute-binding protein [Candidatus Eisenbergiella pullistercoris]
MKRKGLCLIMVLCMLAGCAQAGGGNGGAAAEAPAEEEQAGSGLTEEQSAGEDLSRDGLSEDNLPWEEAASTPYGKYPSLVTYTLGKMTGENNSNMPEGDTYENNVYTRYLREALNIQNEDVFEESEEQYTANVRMAIASRELPDVMVVEDRQTLVQLARKGMIADLSQAFEDCASDRLVEMYDSYEVSALDSAMVDGKLMALPEPSFVDGPNLLWLRKDWMDELGLEEPETVEDAIEIIRAFVEKDPGGNGEGNTIGLVCHGDLTGESGYNYEFQLDPVFSSFDAFPKQWVRDAEGNVAYGSIQPETKEALGYLRQLYEEGVLDENFMLRSMTNIAELVVSGQCGSFFGPWWAPNNPLMEARRENPDAQWKPYLLSTTENGKIRYYDQEASYKYVVVSADFEHPEIVFKMASVMFDKMRYEDTSNEGLAEYFQTNVDSTARPLSINIDYNDALYRCYEQLGAALNGSLKPEELQILEHSYYEKCAAYLEHPDTADAEEWAAYMSRIEACALLEEERLSVISPIFSGETETMAEKWSGLQEMEKEAYLRIISGEEELDYFDIFVEEWLEQGGAQITQEVMEAVSSF